MTRSRAAFIFIFITVLLDMVSFGVIIPVFPQLILRLQGGDMAGAAAIFGMLGTAFAVMQVIFAPVQGALSDRYGRRPVILLSNLGLGVDYVVMAIAPTIPILFIGRLISGATSASFSISGAYVADVTPPEKRAARFGMLGVAFGIGFIVGPAIGGLLGAIDLRAPFWFSAVRRRRPRRRGPRRVPRAARRPGPRHRRGAAARPRSSECAVPHRVADLLVLRPRRSVAAVARDPRGRGERTGAAAGSAVVAAFDLHDHHARPLHRHVRALRRPARGARRARRTVPARRDPARVRVRRPGPLR